MPLFVHVTAEHTARRIRRSGLAGPRGVYCMPLVPDYYRSHQWVREIKRSGQRTMVAIDFRLPADERVLVGRYNEVHREMTAGEAAGIVRAAVDGLGYEVIVPHAVAPRAIHRIRQVSQVLGWRYDPGAHGRAPCGCPACLRRGEIKGRRLRQRYLRTEWYYRYQVTPYPALLAELRGFADAVARDPADTVSEDDACAILRWIGHRKAGTPRDIAFLLEHPSEAIVVAVASMLASYRGREARMLLLLLCGHAHATVREAAAESLCDSAGPLAPALLAPFSADEAIARVLEEGSRSAPGGA